MTGMRALRLRRRVKDICFVVGLSVAGLIAIMGDPQWLLGARSHDAAPQLVGAALQPANPETPSMSVEAQSFLASNDIVPLDGSNGGLSASASAVSRQLVIPRIALQAEVVEVGLINGEWSVPRSVVGHLAETANPGEPGNAVFAGHVVAGGRDNIFARLHELAAGDEMSFLNGANQQRFRVTATRLVRNTDTSVLAGTPSASVVTLITCAGQWLPQENDYDQRLVVVATAA